MNGPQTKNRRAMCQALQLLPQYHHITDKRNDNQDSYQGNENQSIVDVFSLADEP